MISRIKNNISEMSLITKVIFVSSFCYIVAVFLFIWATGHVEQKQVLQKYHDSSRKYLEFVVDYVRNNPDYYAVQTDYFTKYPGLVGLKINSNDEQTVYVADKQIESSMYAFFDENYSLSENGLLHDDETYSVHIVSEYSSLDGGSYVLGVFEKSSVLDSVDKRMLLESILASIVGVVFVILMSKMIGVHVKRLQILSDNLEGAVDGEKLVDKLSGERDETTVLASSFDRIFSSVRQREQEISKKNLLLEDEIRKRKELEIEKSALQRQLFHAQKMESIGQLTGGIAHDFNNILSSIIGYSKLLRSSVSESGKEIDIDRTLDYLDEVVMAGDRAKDLISNMLSFSRGDKSSVTARESVSPETAVKESISMLKSVLPSSLQLNTSVHGNLPYIEVDSLSVHQVLMNLLINARDAMEGQGKLDINIYLQTEPFRCASCFQDVIGSYIIVEVKDHGPGIPPESLNTIFEPFYSTKEVGKGTGMGLSIVHGIMHDSNGHITVESSPGIGSRFKLHFPVVAEKNMTPVLQEVVSEFESVGNSDNVVMLVDDDVPVAKFIMHILENESFKVEMFNEPERALEAIRKDPQRYNIIVTDNMMPGMTGEQLVSKIREFNKITPVLMCTGYRGQLSEAFLNSGYFKRIFDKPIDVDGLLNEVRQCAVGG